MAGATIHEMRQMSTLVEARGPPSSRVARGLRRWANPRRSRQIRRWAGCFLGRWRGEVPGSPRAPSYEYVVYRNPSNLTRCRDRQLVHERVYQRSRSELEKDGSSSCSGCQGLRSRSFDGRKIYGGRLGSVFPSIHTWEAWRQGIALSRIEGARHSRCVRLASQDAPGALPKSATRHGGVPPISKVVLGHFLAGPLLARASVDQEPS